MVAHNQRVKDVARICLGILAGGAVLSLAVLAPNALGPVMNLFEKKGIRDKKRIRSAINYLKRHDLVILREMGGITHVEITEKGKKRVEKYDFENLQIKKPLQWDGKWRIVCFDIPEEKKKGRDALRFKLKKLGFYSLQKSVWAFPYPCDDEINFVSEIFQVSSYVWLMEVVKIDHEKHLRSHFDLDI